MKPETFACAGAGPLPACGCSMFLLVAQIYFFIEKCALALERGSD